MQDNFIAADQRFTDLVEQITSAQWDQIVPATPEWTVKNLVGHVAENNRLVCKTLGVTDDLIHDMDHDPADAWRESAADAENIARTTTDLQQTVKTDMGDMTAHDFLNLMVVDRTVHAYDLAQAIGSDSQFDSKLVAAAYDFAIQHAEDLRDSGALGPVVAVSNDATQLDKLLGLMGRQPSTNQ